MACWIVGGMRAGSSNAPMATSTAPSSGSKVNGVPHPRQKPRRARLELWKCARPNESGRGDQGAVKRPESFLAHAAMADAGPAKLPIDGEADGPALAATGEGRAGHFTASQ